MEQLETNDGRRLQDGMPERVPTVMLMNATGGFKGRALGRSLPLTRKEKIKRKNK